MKLRTLTTFCFVVKTWSTTVKISSGFCIFPRAIKCMFNTSNNIKNLCLKDTHCKHILEFIQIGIKWCCFQIPRLSFILCLDLSSGMALLLRVYKESCQLTNWRMIRNDFWNIWWQCQLSLQYKWCPKTCELCLIIADHLQLIMPIG